MHTPVKKKKKCFQFDMLPFAKYLATLYPPFSFYRNSNTEEEKYHQFTPPLSAVL